MAEIEQTCPVCGGKFVAKHPGMCSARCRAEGTRVEVKDQPQPTQNEKPSVWPLVVKDMIDRDFVGRERYGTPLHPFNGRKQLVDAYQEALDLVVYLRAELWEREQIDKELAELRARSP